jgi:anti-sigma factor RsiW
MSRDATPTPFPDGTSATPSPDTCVSAVALVSDYLEGALDVESLARFEAHVARCEGCATYLRQMRATITAAGRVDPDRVAPATLERLVGTFRSVAARRV